ncbi:MAG: heme ABC transporter ATP-binding protein [Pseudomonadota bacterium]
MLQANSVHLTLGKRPVLRGIDFNAKPEALTAIVGPNGSGKTTLLRALTGDVTYRGRVTLDGKDIRHCKPWQLAARRAVLPQATQLAFPFTVYEVVRLGLSAGLEAERDHLIPEALARVGLAGFEGRFYQELSGGEQQRSQLARVMVQVWEPVVHGKPSWMFLDEPVASLDIGHQLEIMTLAQNYAKAGGGVVAVMHDLNLTAMFADSVAMLNGGRLVHQGTAKAVLTNENLSSAYGCQLQINTPPPDQEIYVLPHATRTYQ